MRRRTTAVRVVGPTAVLIALAFVGSASHHEDPTLADVLNQTVQETTGIDPGIPNADPSSLDGVYDALPPLP